MNEMEVVPPQKGRPLTLLGFPLRYVLIVLAAIVSVGIYTGVLLFGPNSLTVLLGLEEQHTTLQRHIEYLKAKNAALQKEYFELKQLEPEP